VADQHEIEERLKLAQEHRRDKRWATAEDICRGILHADPNHAETLHLLALTLSMQGRRAEAVPVYQQALQQRGDLPEAWVNLGAALRATGKPQDAVAALRKAIDLHPELFEAWFNLGNALAELRQWPSAAEAFTRAASLRADFADAWLNLGAAKMHEGKFAEALDAYDRAKTAKPTLAAAWISGGTALFALGNDRQAIDYFRRGLQMDPGNAPALGQMAAALRRLGEYDVAAVALRRAVAISPHNGDALVKLSALLQDICLLQESLRWCEKYLELNPTDVDIASFRLCSLHLNPNFTPEKIFQEHLEWDKRFGGKSPPPMPRREHSPIRIGYVSPDFRLHSVAFFLESLLEHHDRAQFEIYCFSNVPKPDDVTERFKKLSTHWREITGKSNDEVEKIIREDEIDILIDLAGHTADNRLQVFARRVAPVQVTYLGYPGSTGLKEMDFRLTDAWADPPGMTERFHTERLVRLPQTLACYRPWQGSPEPSRKRQGPVTFGCFTVLRKVGDELLNAWGEILSQVDGSKLFLGAIGLRDPTVRHRLSSLLARHGIAENRLIFQDVVPMDKYFASHREVDLILDTFPVNGHTVVCHALWMGVQVVTLAGDLYGRRLASSVLNNLGLSEWVAHSPQEYVALAVKLAGDLPNLDLRERLKSSPVMDARQFTRDVENAYREMWNAIAPSR
jgi:protein O-GlcNAc transferase